MVTVNTSTGCCGLREVVGFSYGTNSEDIIKAAWKYHGTPEHGNKMSILDVYVYMATTTEDYGRKALEDLNFKRTKIWESPTTGSIITFWMRVPSKAEMKF